MAELSTIARPYAEALFAVARDSGESLDGWLAAKAWRKRALGICTTAVHAGLAGHPVDAVNTVRKLVDDIRQLR